MVNKIDPLFEPAGWLQEAGFTTYIVGNQVRNLLLGTKSDTLDVDMATSATPGQVAYIVRSHRIGPSLVDEKFGVTSFVHNGIRFEVTTFREDIYGKEFAEIKRYPDLIRFIRSAKQDALRRDLTINGVYYNPATHKYLDYVGGIKDLQAGVIRIIGEPKLRFQEDPIRMLRCIRFAHKLGFRYTAATSKALMAYAPLLAKVSPTVIKKELAKLKALENYKDAKQDLIHFGFLKLI